MSTWTKISTAADPAALAASAGVTKIVLTPMQAASDPRNAPLLRTIRASMNRIGLPLNDAEKIDVLALNRALTASGVSLSARMDLKSMLYQLRLIEA
jgi:hypothetical protein